MNNLEFALEMKNKRLASGLSQGELASLTHVSRYSINRFENGKANASKETQNISACMKNKRSRQPKRNIRILSTVLKFVCVIKRQYRQLKNCY